MQPGAGVVGAGREGAGRCLWLFDCSALTRTCGAQQQTPEAAASAYQCSCCPILVLPLRSPTGCLPPPPTGLLPWPQLQPALRSLTGSMLATICSSARIDTGSSLVAPHGGGSDANGSAAATQDGSSEASEHCGKQGSKARKRGAKPAATLHATPYAAASDYYCAFAEDPEMQAAIDAVMDAHGAVVEACAGECSRVVGDAAPCMPAAARRRRG